MYLVELYKIIEDGENSQVEFKRKFTEAQKIAKEMIAFANTKGGMILFGVDDDREIYGISSEKSEIELIDTAAKFYCEPEVQYTYEIISMKKKDILIIHIPESKNKPHYLINDVSDVKRVYIRDKDASVIASKETINILKHSNPDSKPLVISYGKNEKILMEYLSEHNRITVKEFKKLANISERRAGRTLVNLVRAQVIRHNRDGNYEYYTLIT
jgi:predicted HTH transcriptional regulator